MRIRFLDKAIFKTKNVRAFLSKLLSWALLYGGLLTIIIMIYDAGFPKPIYQYLFLNQYYLFFLGFVLAIKTGRTFLNLFDRDKHIKHKQWEFLFFLVFLFLYLWLYQKFDFSWIEFLLPYRKIILAFVFIVVILYEYIRFFIKISSRNVNPAFVFVTIFFLLTLLGTLMLLLPNSTYDGISLINALFTSVSAVCLTGLTVVDFSEVFTPFGHKVILVLIQVGGIGIITFAGMIGRVFSSKFAFQQQIALKDNALGDRLSGVSQVILKIVSIVFMVEIIGAVGIFFSTLDVPFEGYSDRIFFCVFHSVSAFCNAGLVTFEHGMQNELFRFNYVFQLIIAGLFLFGGIGFPIVFSLYHNFKQYFKNLFRKVFYGLKPTHVARRLDINSKLSLYTTLVLIVVSFILIWIFEGNRSLFEHHLFGKIVSVFFAAVTPRSAGFSTVDMAYISLPTIMLYLLMMWIGASPGGTGGGVKTTTFSLAVLNFWSLSKGREKIVLFGREIQQGAIKRAFAIISLSILFMGSATFLIYSFDGHLDLINIVFDVFSGFNNSGLSLGVTSELSVQSKLILATTIFAGRVGALTLFSAFLYKKRLYNHKYPTQDIIF